MKSLPSITVLGTGAVGSALRDFFEKYGYMVRSYWNRNSGHIWDENGQSYQPSRTGFPSKTGELGDWIFITTPDGAIGPTAQKLAAISGSWNQKYVIHCSGNMTSAECKPLAEKGARTASMHPLQTFQKGDGNRRFKDIYISLEGEKTLVDELQKVVQKMEAIPIRVSPRQKRKLHVAAVFASNYLVALMATSEQIIEEAGMIEGVRLLDPLVRQTLANILEYGVENALTGPVARGDAATVCQHLESLKSDRQKSDLYRLLGQKALEIARERGNLPEHDLGVLRDLLEEK